MNWDVNQLQIPLSDHDWGVVRGIFDKDMEASYGRPRQDPRRVLDAILWIEVNKESWKRLPPTFPPTQTCYNKYLKWRQDGTLERSYQMLIAHRESSRGELKP